jgi:hypothetical protein
MNAPHQPRIAEALRLRKSEVKANTPDDGSISAQNSTRPITSCPLKQSLLKADISPPVLRLPLVRRASYHWQIRTRNAASQPTTAAIPSAVDKKTGHSASVKASKSCNAFHSGRVQRR